MVLKKFHLRKFQSFGYTIKIQEPWSRNSNSGLKDGKFKRKKLRKNWTLNILLKTKTNPEAQA